MTVYSGSGAVTGISGASFTDVAATDRFNAPIVFTSDEDGDDEIWAMSATGTLLTQLTNDTGLDYQPSYSPDGTKIYFTSSRDYTGASVSYEIYSMTSTGASETRLAIDTETTQENASSMPLWQTRYIGTSGRLGTACAGFLFGRAGARVVANSPGDSSLSNLFFTLTTTVGLSSISYVNSFDTVSLFPAVAVSRHRPARRGR